ncbi:MAG: FAD:protein FMN transferase [Planctomycetota bacterium]
MKHRAALLPVVLACAAACGGDAHSSPAVGIVQELRGRTMGSTWTVKWHGAPRDAVAAAVQEELDATDATFSNWRDDSEIAAFNRYRGTEPWPASERLCAAVRLALQMATWTGGAFDPTVRPLSALFRERKAGRAVDEGRLLAALRRVDFRQLEVEGEALRKRRPDVEIDLDGLVAGLCADRLGPRLRALGAAGFMLEITGEVLCAGRKPDGSPWFIGIVDPERAEPGHEQPLTAIPVLDRALCTSGDYRNVTVVDGRVVTHVFDPRTGANPEHGVVSVSVLAESCAVADGLGTALMVLGPGGAAAALAASGDAVAGAWFVVADQDGALGVRAARWPEAFAPDGRPLPRPTSPPATQQEREAALAAAEVALRARPDDVDAVVWVGRRLGYLGRFRDAIAHYTAALERHPREPHLLRHRGHRFLTVRDFEAARADLQHAAAAVQGTDDEVEPDGLPVAGRPPHSTLQGNIQYHLGLAHFCLGDFAAAEAAMRACLALARNDEMTVAATHWLWCALARQGRADEAAAQLAAIPTDPDVVENIDYLRLCRLYRDGGELPPLPACAEESAAFAFGIANLAWQRRATDAPARLAQVAARPDWPAFGVMAAQALAPLTAR